jgi:hypothetical protein
VGQEVWTDILQAIPGHGLDGTILLVNALELGCRYCGVVPEH